MKNNKIPLSVAIITKNEEERLPDCLKGVSFAEDIVVVDSGSTDRTVEIAKEFGCRVFMEEWKGYGPQKNSAVAKCKHDWVLVIDADERIPEETKNEIVKIINSPDMADVYSFPRKNIFHGRWIKHSGWWPDRVIRLFKRQKGRFESLVHEKWMTRGAIMDLNVYIEHYSFDNYSEMVKKLDEYSTINATELFNKGFKVNTLSPILHGVSMFIKSYILEKGFLEGFDGLIIALSKAGGSFFKYAKLLELQRNK
ncbi:MAG: glycosyltransferase family 2 protein [Nitrospirota bacterium]